MRSLHKNIIREITKTKSRFFSILAIIALSTGFFTGVKSSSPSMIATGCKYFQDQNLMDFRLLSTVGFDDDDIRAISELEPTADVMPGYFSDLIMTKDNIDTVIRVYSLPKKTDTNRKIINEPVIEEGRLPRNRGECAIESYYARITGTKPGDTIVFNDTVQNSPTTDIVKDLEYTITGIVSTPMYVTYQRGNTTLGDGTISFFMMIPSEEFVIERYTDVYVTTAASQSGLSPMENQYKSLIESQSKDYEALADERIRIFNDSTLKDAEKKLNDAKKEYNDKKKETFDKINSGEKKLHEGENTLSKKLAEGEKALADAEKKIRDGKEKLKKAEKEYSDGIEAAKKKIAEGEKKYNEGNTKYIKAKNQYDTQIAAAQKKLDDAQGEYNVQYTIFYGTTKPDAEMLLNLSNSGIKLAQELIAKLKKEIRSIEKQADIEIEAGSGLDELKDKLKKAEADLEDQKKKNQEAAKKLREGEKKLAQAKADLAKAKKEFQAKKAQGAKQLSDATIQLSSAKSQLDMGKLEYETAMTTGILKISSAQRDIDSAADEVKKGREELEKQKASGLNTIKISREKLLAGKVKAKAALDDAEKKLRDAEDKIDKLKNAKWTVSGRNDNPGYSGLEEDAQRVDNVATVFPVFFTLVAALVCLTSMSRMVEERRTEIGTLKALGYSNGAIVSKYLIYSSLASVIGSIIGTVLGIFTLPFIILDTYSIMYTLPKTVLVISWTSFAFSAGLGIACTSLVSLISCLSELKLQPAVLMRPKAPKPGKRILLESITFLWKHMNFTSKVTARNLFRYKARFLMTVIGVAGCTALIIGGLGLKDSMSVIADLQYKEITVFDQVYALSDPGTSKEMEYLMSQFHGEKSFRYTSLVSQNWTTVRYNENKSKIDLRYVIGEDQKSFRDIFTLRDRHTHEEIPLTEKGIVINERLSEVTGIGTGEMLNLEIDNKKYQARVTALTENYAGNYIYMTPEFFKDLTGKEPLYNLVYVTLEEDALENGSSIANEWMKKDEIITVSMLAEQLEAILSTLDSMNVIVLVLVFCAGLLAVIVLYNLTNINIAERVREIATIKVLGFYDLETANYIYRENIILSLTGALVGLPLGSVFITFILKSIQMDMVMFPNHITLTSYLAGFLLTLLFSFLVNFIMYFKIRKISMVESLKSIE